MEVWRTENMYMPREFPGVRMLGHEHHPSVLNGKCLFASLGAPLASLGAPLASFSECLFAEKCLFASMKSGTNRARPDHIIGDPGPV